MFGRKSSPEVAEYKAAKADLAKHATPDTDEFVAANDRVVAAQKKLPRWNVNRTK
jgi:hypothetical protein